MGTKLSNAIDGMRRYWWAWLAGGALFVVGVFTDWIDQI